MKYLLIILAGIYHAACMGPTYTDQPPWTSKCGDYNGKGEIRYGSYTFCSTVPLVIEYSYKTGFWQFWNREGDLVGEGNFIPVEVTINDAGGCPYAIIRSKASDDFRIFHPATSVSSTTETLMHAFESCKAYPMMRQRK